mmetsp:Transcript_16868/g.46609  ORF Transcript_16868/g.46609 Transcript_16868/m.46609 type:complete len:160 (-) Transcript_16868:483-962(-)
MSVDTRRRNGASSAHAPVHARTRSLSGCAASSNVTHLGALHALRYDRRLRFNERSHGESCHCTKQTVDSDRMESSRLVHNGHAEKLCMTQPSFATQGFPSTRDDNGRTTDERQVRAWTSYAKHCTREQSEGIASGALARNRRDLEVLGDTSTGWWRSNG